MKKIYHQQCLRFTPFGEDFLWYKNLIIYTGMPLRLHWQFLYLLTGPFGHLSKMSKHVHTYSNMTGANEAQLDTTRCIRIGEHFQVSVALDLGNAREK